MQALGVQGAVGLEVPEEEGVALSRPHCHLASGTVGHVSTVTHLELGALGISGREGGLTACFHISAECVRV